MEVIEIKSITADEFFRMPDPSDGTRLELVRGEIVALPLRGLEQAEVRGIVAFHIHSFLSQNRLGRASLGSGIVVERNPDTVRSPDVSYYSKERLPLDFRVAHYHDQAPDLCAEVASPFNTLRQVYEKLKEYFRAGVRMVWVVDPEDHSVVVYRDSRQGIKLHQSAILDGGEVLPGFSCKVAELFG